MEALCSTRIESHLLDTSGLRRQLPKKVDKPSNCFGLIREHTPGRILLPGPLEPPLESKISVLMKHGRKCIRIYAVFRKIEERILIQSKGKHAAPVE